MTCINCIREDGPFDISRAGWIGDYNDPQNFLMINMGNTPFNSSRWKSPEYDALMNKAAETLDLGERAKVLAEAETLLLDQLPVIPILSYSSRALVSTKVGGYEDNLMDKHPTRWMSVN